MWRVARVRNLWSGCSCSVITVLLPKTVQNLFLYIITFDRFCHQFSIVWLNTASQLHHKGTKEVNGCNWFFEMVKVHV